MEVLPAVVAFLPRYARFSGQGVPTTARHKGVFDHREGVAFSPFDNNYNEMRSRMRVHLERGNVGSCSLLLRGRLQRRFEFRSLRLLSDLLSKKISFSLIVNDCIVHSIILYIEYRSKSCLIHWPIYSIYYKPTKVGF